MSRKGRPVDLDAPSPTVLTHGRRDTQSELTLPASAEGTAMKLRYGNAAPFTAKGRELSLDAPLPTVMGLNEMHNGHQFILEDDGAPLPEPPSEPDKPPYRVPSMAEIAAVPDNGLRVVSTFSGCGGSCLGFEMAGYRVLWANEFIPAAQEVYRANHPGVILSTANIRDVAASDILDAIALRPGELDVLEGSPPCASFSTAGKREAHWGKVKNYSDGAERTDDLFFEYIRLLDGLRPRVFVAENVSGLVKGTAKGYFKLILRAMRDVGYRVEARLLDAQWLGVPQARQRIIFVGVRNDLDAAPVFPAPLPYRYSVRDALPHIAKVRSHSSEVHTWHDAAESPSPSISASAATRSETAYFGGGGFVESIVGIEHANGYNGHADMSPDAPMPTIQAGRSDVDLADTALGVEWDKLRPGETSERYFNLVKPDPDAPCPTVTAIGGSSPGTASVTHPVERRKFTIAELKRICAFPDDFQLSGSYAQQWERLGRAVPPLMMRAVAETIAREIFDAS